MGLPKIEPALLNTACPWATTKDDLQALFDCPYTGAITTRTSLINGFAHNSSHHQYAFFTTDKHTVTKPNSDAIDVPHDSQGSLNTLGYSPTPLATYLDILHRILLDSSLNEERKRSKTIIISVTGSSESIVECLKLIQAFASTTSNPICMEINLSCPNIPGKPPPAYARSSLTEYLTALQPSRTVASSPSTPKVYIGIKTPPYTYHDQFQTLLDALSDATTPQQQSPVDFITTANTLGSCLLLSSTTNEPALASASGTGIGGMAGTPLHPLALGNVRTLRSMLDARPELKDIAIIGVGGVKDAEGRASMVAAGAAAVGVATALGRVGVGVFKDIV